MSNRRYLTPVATWSATYPQLGVDESHPTVGETTDFYQKLINNIAYVEGHMGSSNLTQTVNADGYTLTGGTPAARSFTLSTGDFAVVPPAAGATFTLGGNLTTTGAFNTSFTQAASCTFALPPANSNLVGTTGGVLTAVVAGGGSSLTMTGSLSVVSAGTVTITMPAAGGAISLAGNLATTGAFNTSFTQGASCTLILPTTSGAWIMGSTGTKMLTVGLADGFTIAGGTISRMLTIKDGALVVSSPAAGATVTLAGNLTTTSAGTTTITAPAGGATIAVAGNLTTTGGAATITVPAGGATINVAGNLTTTGAFNTTIAQVASTTVTLPAVSCTLAPGTALAPVVACPAQVGNDFIPLDIENGKTYVLVGATGAASTVTLPAAAANGTRAYWILDGTLNAHTVQFRDATAARVITPAIAASKHVLVMLVKFGGAWYATYSVEP